MAGRKPSRDRSRKNKLEADLLELQLQRKRAEALPAADVERVWKAVLIGLRQTVNGFDLSLADKAKMLKELSEVEVEKYLS